MDIYEHLPALLKIESQDNKITLRIDQNGLGVFAKAENSIQEVTLSGCRIGEGLVDELQGLVTEVFEYESFSQDDKILFKFRGDYGRIENEIECGNYNETFSEYSKDDLTQKGRALFDLYVDLQQRFTENHGVNTQLRDTLNFEISNEVERARRKQEFFQTKDKSKSDAFLTEIKFLQKMQRILTCNFEN